ncbi:SpaA isopeptide-forming pilin-related protein [Enterococcus rivorum]|uniref:SpaA isopeptide-forming pilin-related protein n=1 Tax=Enterococcus rivorum TaxID=762845 RepID=UPI0036367005
MGIKQTIPYNWNNQEVYTKGYKYVSIIEKIDPNLIFESIAFSRPKNYARRDVPYSELNQIPRVTFKFEVNTVGNYKTTEVDSEKLATVPLMQLKRSDLKLVDSDRVLSYQVVYENRDGSAIQGGFASDTMGVMYRVKEGYVGRITNNLSYEGQVIGAATPFYRYPTNDDPATAIGPRSANVVKASTSIPVVSTAVTMVNKENVVETGDNKIFISLKNEVSSQIRVNKPINAAILLPEGVKLKSNPMPDYMDATGLRTSLRADARGGSYTNVTSNYNNTNRQLVRVKWNDPDLLPGQSVGAWLDVDVAATAPSPLLPIVYGFSGNSKFTVPTATGNSLTNSILEVDSDDLNGDANKTQNRVKSGNSYVMLREMNVQTEKLIKGERDSTYSRLGHTIPGGKIDYQLKISNTNNEPLTKFVLMDILPSVGDLGITDGAQRGSLFTPSMTGPITVPSDWVNKVTVSYSTAVNPKRDDLVKNVIYPGTTQKLTNPSSATTPTWLAASNVTNWATIHSFKIELNSGVSWVKGQGITLNFSMKAPDEVSIIDRSILDPAKEETSRAAWNSFAYGANTMQIVEPERVGVVMNGLGKVSIQKVDAANVATRLSGATFVIGATEDQLNSGNYIKIGSNGSLVYPGDLAYSTSLKNYEVTTNSQGIAQFEKLNLDGTNGKKYYLKEIKAPTGYQLPTKNIAVTASLDTSPATIQIGNIKKIAIPQTGSISLVLFLIIGTGLVGTGVMRYIKQQKNQKTIKQKRRGN